MVAQYPSILLPANLKVRVITWVNAIEQILSDKEMAVTGEITARGTNPT